MRILKDVIKRNIAAIILWPVFSVTAFAVFRLYEANMEALWYSMAIGLFFVIVFIAVEFAKEKKRSVDRAAAISSVENDPTGLPEAFTAADEDYQEMIALLGRKIERLEEEFSSERQDSLDYYTAWVHQIKTPIAVMKMKLSEDSPENMALRAELFRIEQYVDMVLQYIRLGSESTDLMIREYELDELIKEAVRKFAPQFVEKKLSLEFSDTGARVVTDKKWFICILDQLISNAIKYTPEGSITISYEDERLSISDTGIGIAEEDIPRIFEKGFTGNNGRIGEKSSGLGLYLARKAADMMSVPLSVESTVGRGSCFVMDLHKPKM